MALLFTILNALLCATTISALNNSTIAVNASTLSNVHFFHNLSDVLLLDASYDGFWKSELVTISLNNSALDNYYNYLQKGWFGQAIRERYAFDGQIFENGTVGSTDMLLDDLILSDLAEFLEQDDYRIPESKLVFQQALDWNSTDSAADPGRGLLESIVYVLKGYNPLVKRTTEDAYTTHCNKQSISQRPHCRVLWDRLLWTGSVSDGYESYYRTCYIRAPGKFYMTHLQLKAEAGLIMEDCGFTKKHYATIYAQGFIPASASRRKVCVQDRTTGC